MSFQELYVRLKRTLGQLTGRDWREVFAHQNLSEDLGFSGSGKRALASDLNQEFAAEELQLTPDETGAAETVRDLARLIQEELG